MVELVAKANVRAKLGLNALIQAGNTEYLTAYYIAVNLFQVLLCIREFPVK